MDIGCLGRRGRCRSSRQDFFDTIHIQAAGVAAFETVQHFAGFVYLSGLIVEDAQRGIAAGPFGQQIHSPFETLGGLCGFAFESRDNSQAPKNFSRAGNSRQAFLQGLLRAADDPYHAAGPE